MGSWIIRRLTFIDIAEAELIYSLATDSRIKFKCGKISSKAYWNAKADTHQNLH